MRLQEQQKSTFLKSRTLQKDPWVILLIASCYY